MTCALRDKPAGMTVTTHMCRGNFRSSWVAQGGYEFVADALFNELNVDGNSLSRDEQIAKLRLVAETAAEVWGTP